ASPSPPRPSGAPCEVEDGGLASAALVLKVAGLALDLPELAIEAHQVVGDHVGIIGGEDLPALHGDPAFALLEGGPGNHGTSFDVVLDGRRRRLGVQSIVLRLANDGDRPDSDLLLRHVYTPPGSPGLNIGIFHSRGSADSARPIC